MVNVQKTVRKKPPSLNNILRAAFDTATEIIIITDSFGYILDVNVAIEKDLGYKKEEIIGLNIEHLLPKGDYYSFIESTEIETLLKNKDSSEIWYSITTSNHENHTIFAFKNIHQEKKLQEQRDEFEKSLTDVMMAQSHYEEQASRVVEIAETLDVKKKKIEERNKIIEYQANHDPLTKLGNRFLLKKTFKNLVSEVIENNYFIGFIYIDLDNLKLVNDKLGHERGDYVICKAANILKREIGINDLPVRLGGDEFGILMLIEEKDVKAHIKSTAEKILNKINIVESNDEIKINVTASIGIAINEKNAGLDKLLSKADSAMYRAKNSGKGKIC